MKKEERDTALRVLVSYLEHFLPADRGDENAILKSSQEIQDDLAGMLEIPLQDISAEMLECGYHIVVDGDSKPRWAMMRR